MPLSEGKSNAARQRNIQTEIEAGKPIKQAVAIGYAKQRENKRGASDCSLADLVSGFKNVNKSLGE